MSGTKFHMNPENVGSRPSDLSTIEVNVTVGDAFDCARNLQDQGYQPTIICGLSNQIPGGAAAGGMGQHEGRLFCRSTCGFVLNPDYNPKVAKDLTKEKAKIFKVPPQGGIEVPNVEVFRASANYNFRKINPSTFVNMIFTDLSSCQSLNPEQFIVTMQDKIKAALRIAIKNDAKSIIFDESGCSSDGLNYHPEIVADCFKAVLKDPEFQGKLHLVAFACIDPEVYFVFQDKLHNMQELELSKGQPLKSTKASAS